MRKAYWHQTPRSVMAQLLPPDRDDRSTADDYIQSGPIPTAIDISVLGPAAEHRQTSARLSSMKRQTSWMSLAFDSWRLGVESSAVIAMRMARMSTGDAAAATEARLMVAEKIEALAALQIQAFAGGLGTTPERQARATVAHYRKVVGNSRRRLSKARAKA